MTSTKRNILGVLVDALDYDRAVDEVLAAAEDARPCAVTALAVHGVMTGVKDATHRHRLNRLDIVTPDGQPVRWALNLLHGAKLRDRVYGPELTLRVCAAAARRSLPVYFYGSDEKTVQRLAANLAERYPGLVVAGAEPSRFRPLVDDEREELAARVRGSGARIVFVGLGCPRQEVFVYENRERFGVPTLAVGAAFDFHAGNAKEPPALVQKYGFQWLHRLLQDPRRLWRRYLLLNPEYLMRLSVQRTRLWRPDPAATVPPQEDVRPG
jgi:N-acetylglucosaminyldiphosphoundecaprenol N-acetyl-beta-D-mannosaminyltransferase